MRGTMHSHPRHSLSPAGQRSALAHYGHASLEARVAAASPHQLVQMLFDRLQRLLRDARDAAATGDGARRLRAAERALAIVDGLESSLDDARGGEVAASLRTAYALVRDGLLLGREQPLGEALVIVEAVGEAWRSIRPS